ncbi:hypothetical protein PLICRDRAFT_49059 [Plicaturopsis crispa FD-325 SS-3]|nr:hypothetical protein PLICRDRAFT_49059 [Plicaturopsis crispa FD-325 SS-3]
MALEALSLAANIMQPLTIAKDLVEVVMAIKRSVDKMHFNDNRLRGMVERISGSVGQLHTFVLQCQKQGAPADLVGTLTDLDINLRRVSKKCEEMQRPSKPNAKDTLDAWRKRGSIAEEIEQVERQVQHCLHTFTAMACARIEYQISHRDLRMQSQLNRLEASLNRLLRDVESDPGRAEEVLSVEHIDRPAIRAALRRASIALTDAPLTMESRYHRTKVSTLTRAVGADKPHRPPPSPAYSRESSEAYSDPADLLGQTIRLINELRHSEGNQLNAQLAALLHALSVSLHEKGFYEDSHEASKWAMQIYTQLSQGGELKQHGTKHQANRRSEDPQRPAASVSGMQRMPSHQDDSDRWHSLSHSYRDVASHDDLTSRRPYMPIPAILDISSPQDLLIDMRYDFRERDDEYEESRAASLTSACTHASNEGRHHESLSFAERVVTIYRRLSRRRPGFFDAHLALALNNVAVSLRNLRLYDKAIQSAEEAVHIYRTLANENHRQELATYLHTYSMCLHESGSQDTKALEISQEALRIRQDLAQGVQHDQSHTRATSRSRGLVGFLKRPLSRGPSAAKKTKVKADSLTSHSRTSTQSDLAASYLGTSSCLIRLESYQEACQASREANSLYATLATVRPESFVPQQAISLSNLHLCLDRLRLHADALPIAEELVRVRRWIVEGHLTTENNALLADAHYHLFTTLRQLKRHKEALKAIRSARKLASSLHGLSVCLTGLHLDEDALAAAAESARYHRELAHAHPDPQTSQSLASALIHFSDRSYAVGRHRRALEAGKEALRIYRRLAIERPQVFSNSLARSLRRIGACYTYLGHAHKAKRAHEESLRLRFSGS